MPHTRLPLTKPTTTLAGWLAGWVVAVAATTVVGNIGKAGSGSSNRKSVSLFSEMVKMAFIWRQRRPCLAHDHADLRSWVEEGTLVQLRQKSSKRAVKGER